MEDQLHTSSGRLADGRPFVGLEGELDLATLPVAEAAFDGPERRSPPELVLDLRGLQFIDSTGVRFVVQARARAGDAGRRLVFLLPAGGPVRRMFDLTGLLGQLDVEDLPDPPAPAASNA